jgi:hypothetical protein
MEEERELTGQQQRRQEMVAKSTSSNLHDMAAD